MTPLTRCILVAGCLVVGLLELPRARTALAASWGGPYAERPAPAAHLPLEAPPPPSPPVSGEPGAQPLSVALGAASPAARGPRGGQGDESSTEHPADDAARPGL